MHPLWAAVLVWLAAVSAPPAMAIEICSRVSAEGGVAACGDLQARDIIVGLKPIEVQELMRELFAQESAAIAKVEELSKQFGVTDAAMKQFFAILGERQVPVEELPERLAEIATQHKDLLTRVERTVSTDPGVQARREEAKAAIEAGEYDRAERLLNEAEARDLSVIEQMQADIERRQAALEARKLSAAETVGNKGALMMTQLRYPEAARYFAQAVVLTPEHHQELLSDRLTAWGEAARRGGDYPAALDAARRALALDEARLPADDAQLGSRLNNLALMLKEIGRYPEAEPLLKRAIAIGEKTLGPEHPDLAQGLNNLAGLYWATGRYPEAEPLLKRALAIREKTLPPNHPHRMEVRENYAVLLDRLGRPAEAAELRTQTQAIR